jgi:hypothetical protein
MKRRAVGLVIATSLVALSACQKTETPNAIDKAVPTEVMAENNMTVMAENNMTDSSSGGADNSAMAGNNTTADGNSTDPHGGSSGH